MFRSLRKLSVFACDILLLSRSRQKNIRPGRKVSRCSRFKTSPHACPNHDIQVDFANDALRYVIRFEKTPERKKMIQPTFSSLHVHRAAASKRCVFSYWCSDQHPQNQFQAHITKPTCGGGRYASNVTGSSNTLGCVAMLSRSTAGCLQLAQRPVGRVSIDAPKGAGFCSSEKPPLFSEISSEALWLSGT